jgi:hypothetical protein
LSQASPTRIFWWKSRLLPQHKISDTCLALTMHCGSL